MFRWIIGSLVTVGVSGLVIAAEQPLPGVATAVTQQHPGSTMEVTRTRQVNGVNVQDVKITTGGRTTTATITANGDYLASASPQTLDTVPAPVKQMVTQTFSQSPADISKYTATVYVVDVNTGGQKHRLIFDGAGRLHDIKSSQEGRWEDKLAKEKASGADAKRMEAIPHPAFPNATITGTYRVANLQNFNVLEFRTQKGRDGVLIVNDQGQPYSWMVTMASSELPAPVTEAIKRDFKSANIENSYRRQFEYYQVNQALPGGQTVTLNIQPDGKVMKVENEAARAEAITAKHQQ